MKPLSVLKSWFDPSDPDTLRLRREQLGLALAVGRGGPLAMIIIVAGISAVALQWHGPGRVAVWAAIALAGMMVNRTIAIRVKRRLEAGGPYAPLNAAYFAGCVVIVLSIASSGPLFWVPGDPANHLFVLLLLMVGTNLGVVQQAMHPPAAAAGGLYLATAFGLCIAEQDFGHLLLAALGSVMLVILVDTSKRTARSAEAVLKLRISEQALLEQHKEMAAELREANRAKSEFFARMSHELRTPLNAVIGFSDMMMQQTLGPVGTEAYLDYLKHIHGSGTHLLGLINDILDLSKLEAGRLQLREGEVDLKEAVDGALGMLRLRAAEGGVALINEVPDGLELKADETAVRQILLNLAMNAIKFTPPEGQVRWSAAFDPADKDAVLLRVEDTGCGIAAADIAHVFEPFGQSRGAFEAKERGTGPGLPIVRSLMQLHGGEASIDSVLGEGTTVTLRFPAARLLHSGRRAAA